MMPVYDNGNSLWYRSNIRETFADPNLNFSNRKINGETTKECLRYVKDWSLLDNEKIYDIPKLVEKYRLEINEDYSEKRLEKEVKMIEEHMEYLKTIREKGYKEIVKAENKYHKNLLNDEIVNIS